MTQALIEEEIIVAELVEEDDLACQFWHQKPTACDQEPKYVGFLIECHHPHLCCERHYQIFNYGRLCRLDCECGVQGYSTELDFVPL